MLLNHFTDWRLSGVSAIKIISTVIKSNLIKFSKKDSVQNGIQRAQIYLDLKIAKILNIMKIFERN